MLILMLALAFALGLHVVDPRCEPVAQPEAGIAGAHDLSSALSQLSVGFSCHY